MVVGDSKVFFFTVKIEDSSNIFLKQFIEVGSAFEVAGEVDQVVHFFENELVETGLVHHHLAPHPVKLIYPTVLESLTFKSQDSSRIRFALSCIAHSYEEIVEPLNLPSNCKTVEVYT